MLPVEIQTRFEPIHSILAGLVKFLAVGCGLNEIAGGLRLYGSHIAPGPYDLGRGCAGLPGLKTIS